MTFVTDGPSAATGPVTSALDHDPGTGQVTSITDPLDHTTELRYDAEGNLDEHELPTGEVTSFTQDTTGRVTSVVDPRGNESGADPDDFRTELEHDDGDLVTLITDPLGNDTSLGYDDAGNLTNVTDARNNTTSWTYDDASRLSSVVAPGGATTSYTYDETWNLATRTDDNGHVTSYGYDDANRVTSMTNELGTWTYDVDAAGRTTQTGLNGGGTVALTYDPLGRVTGIDYSDTTPDVSFAYDANGNRTEMADGAGTVTYDHDALNRLQEVARGADEFTYDWDDGGRITSRTFPDGAVTSYGYDDAGRLTEILLEDATTTIAARTYTLDEVGNPTLIIDEAAEATSYLYDTRNRLTEACFGVSTCTGATDTIAWTYDGVGNRLTETRPAGTTTYTYDDADRLTATTGPAGPDAFDHDARGNQTQAGDAEYAYDLANRMTEAAVGADTTTYAYDGDGLRLDATIDGDAAASRTWQWDVLSPIPEVAVETDGNDDAVASHLFGLTRLGFTDDNDDTWYLHGDHLGSTTAVTDETGDVAWTYHYEPYGLPTADQHDLTAPANPWQYTGQHQDPTGLLHLRARQYNPTTGTFTATDPWIRPTGHPWIAAYAYVDGRPTGAVDPTGQVLNVVVGAVVGGVAGGASTALTQAIEGDGFDWTEIAINTGVGAATGAVSSVCPMCAGVLYGSITTAIDEARGGSLDHCSLARIGLAAALGGFGGAVSPSGFAQANGLRATVGEDAASAALSILPGGLAGLATSTLPCKS